MPFTYVVNVYSDMSLSKGHIGYRGGGHLKSKLKDTIEGVCNCSMFCRTLLYVHSSIAIILMGKREREREIWLLCLICLPSIS